MDRQIKQLTRDEKRELVTNRLKIAPELSDRNIAFILGVSASFVWRIRKELETQGLLKERVHTHDDSWTRHPYLMANKDKLLSCNLSEKSLRALKAPMVLDKMQEIGSLSPRYAQRLLFKERKATNKNTLVNVAEHDVRIFQADLCTGLSEIADDSVQLCFIDMPYDKKSIVSLTPHIATTAARILSEGASLLLMIGGSHLDIALDKLTKANKMLKYQWDIAYVCPRGTPLIQGRRVTTAVKHIIWMTKGKYTGPIQHDIIYAPPDPDGLDKVMYYHGQSVQGIKYILERWSSNGDTICDFMCGGGAVAVAALELGGRKLILSDKNEKAVSITKQRVSEMFGANKRQMQ